MELTDFLYRVHGKHYFPNGSISEVIQGPFKYEWMMEFIEEFVDHHNLNDLQIEINDSKYTYLGNYRLNENGSQLKLSLSDNPIIPVGLFKFLTIDTPNIRKKLCLMEMKKYQYEIIGLDNIHSGLSYIQMFNVINTMVDKNNFGKIRINIYNPTTQTNHLKGYIGRYKFNNEGSKLVPDLIESAIFQLSIFYSEIDTKQVYDKLQSQMKDSYSQYIIIYNDRVVKGSLNDIREFLKSISATEISKVTICDLDDNTVYKPTDILESFKSNNGKNLIY